MIPMNKQEAIEKIKNIGTLNIYDKVAGQQVDLVIKNEVLDIISQIDEPQKVAIPKFVAEWLKKYRHAHTLLKVLNSAEDERIMPSTVNDWILDSQYDFIKAWIDGYEHEKLYTVEIAEAILMKITRGSNIQYKMLPFGNVTDVFDKAIYTTRLTEQEIKQKDERLWQFAKEVE